MMDMEIKRIWLTGFMGTGKSRIARPLAAALDWTAIDIDKLIEDEAHDSIAHIFKSGGEGAFRALESQAVERVASMTNVVIATGGGTVLAEANRAAMKREGFVVLLDARPETVIGRISDSSDRISDRPLLNSDDPLAAATELKQSREQAYRSLADFIIETDDMTPDQVTHQILLAYRERTAVAGSAP
jgi:shikimate kinase